MQLIQVGSPGNIEIPCPPADSEFADPKIGSLQCPLPFEPIAGNRAKFTTNPISIQVYQEKDLAVAAAAEVLFQHLTSNPTGTTGTATGNTYDPIYELVAAKADDLKDRGQGLNLAAHRFFQLDEYLRKGGDGNIGPIHADHPLSYRKFIKERFAGPMGIPLHPKSSNAQWGNVWVPSPNEGEPFGDFCLRYDQARSDARVQLQCLGLGINGHMAFIEPRTGPNAELLFWTRTRVVELTKSTHLANFGRINPEIPCAVSVGVQNILDSEQILIVALGAAKADAVQAMAEGPIGPACPASYLRLLPAGRVKLILDKDAASKLSAVALIS